MELTVNGNPMTVENDITVEQLVQALGYAPGSVAVARNLQCVPRSLQAETRLEEKDEVEILVPFQGG